MTAPGNLTVSKKRVVFSFMDLSPADLEMLCTADFKREGGETF